MFGILATASLRGSLLVVLLPIVPNLLEDGSGRPRTAQTITCEEELLLVD